MATVMNINHFSIYLKRNMECTVILPSDMKNDEKLPVLWLYHGSSGDNTVWLYHSPITEYVAIYILHPVRLLFYYINCLMYAFIRK